MVFRMSGNTSEPPVRPLFFQLHSKFRGIPNVEGVYAFKIPPPPRSTAKLSRATLYKIFTVMLVSVFIIYCTLMMVMIQYQHDSSVLESEGRWGPTLAVSHQVLQEHIQQQAERKRLQMEEELKERRLRDSVSVLSTTNKDSPIAPTMDKNDADSPADLAEVDIHEVQPLEAIHQHDPMRKAEATENVQNDGSNQAVESKNSTNTTKSP